MLINLSNHPSTRWNEKQMNAATTQYQSVSDLAFPNVPPAADEKTIQKMAKQLVRQIKEMQITASHEPFAVHIMGEMTLIFRVIKLLKRAKIKCVASTTERNTIENEDGSKTFLFNFVQFREYT